MNYNISFFEHKRDNLPKQKTIVWDHLIKRAAQPHIRPTKDGPLITGTIFDLDPETEKPRRKKSLAIETSIIFGDIDHGATFDQVGEALDSLLVTGLIYTTYSHQVVTETNPNAEDRLRICIPLAVPIPAAMFDLLWLWLQKQMGGMLDPQAKDVSRIVYTPAISTEDAPYRWAELGGQIATLLDWREIDLEAFRPKKIEHPPWTPEVKEGWEQLLSELRARIAAHPSAHKARGKIHCQGICHGGKSNNALFVNASGVVWCSNEGCKLPDILRAFGLPEKPGRPSVFSRVPQLKERLVKLPNVRR